LESAKLDNSFWGHQIFGLSLAPELFLMEKWFGGNWNAMQADDFSYFRFNKDAILTGFTVPNHFFCYRQH
jgi:hypothetical protein